MPAREIAQLEHWREAAELLRLIAHPIRLMILDSLCKKPRCVKDINSLIPVVQPELSQNIAILRQEKLVGFYSSGTLRCYYILRPSLVRNLIALLKKKHRVQKQDRQSVLGHYVKAKQPVGKQFSPGLKKDRRSAIKLKSGAR
jgi:ArsR family transcriptional regulator